MSETIKSKSPQEKDKAEATAQPVALGEQELDSVAGGKPNDPKSNGRTGNPLMMTSGRAT